jgi:RHS repeat-associated protein
MGSISFSGVVRRVSVLLVGAVVLGTLTIVPTSGGASAGPTPKRSATTPSTQHPVTAPTSTELVGARTAYSSTFALANGKRQTEFSTTPLNYQDSMGIWRKVDNTLVKSSTGGWHSAANGVSVALPASLSTPVRLTKGGSIIGFSLVGGTGTGSVSGSVASYSSVLPATSATYKVTGSGVKESLSLSSASAPSSFVWSLTLSTGLSAQLVGGAVELTNASGVVASIGAPTVTDGSGASGPAGWQLSGSALTLSLDPTWLSAPGRAYPVIVDPSVTYLGPTQGCTLDAAHPTTTYCGTTDLGVGASGGVAQRSVLYYPGFTDGTLPVDAVIQGAEMDLPVDTQSGSVTVNAYALTRGFSSAVTWNSYDGTHSWTTAGGDFATTPTSSATAPGAGNTMALTLPTGLIQSWVNGGAASNGIELKASSETGTNLVDFDPQNSYNDNIIVDWSLNGGTTPSFPLYTHTLDDHLGLAVNTANGNLALHATDLNISGTGLSEVVDRYYNSINQDTYTDGGMGWTTGEGGDIQAQVNTDNVTIYLPGQQPEVFMDNGATWTTPPGVNGTLTEPTSGNYALTLHSSQQVDNFNAQSLCGDNPLTSVVDRNGETITYHYSTTSCAVNGISQLTSITDTQGRTTTVSNGSFLSGLTDPQTPTGRTVDYNYGGYTSSQLLSTEDASGNFTYYGYDTSDSYLTKITDPNGNITTVSYDSSNRVHSVTYVTNVPLLTGPTYTFAYSPGTQGSPDTGSTTVTDSLGHVTTYYYDHLDRTIKTKDGKGNTRSATYNTNSQPLTLQNSVGTTNLGYDSNFNLTSAVAPPSATGQTGVTSTASYATPSGTTGYQYLASSANDPLNNCTAVTYDTAGNPQTAYEGLTPSGGNCNGSTGSDYAKAGYQGDAGVTSCGGPNGVLCTVRDPNGHTTTYGYDTHGNLTSVTPPSPLSAETITYDSLSRVASITDGNGNMTTYTHDAMDRVTQVLYCGTGTCPSPSSTNSIAYTYDADGNLTQRVDNTGTTTWVYDALSRVTKEELPSGSDACSGSSPAGITYTYDTASNRASTCDASGTTSYTYDAANQEVTLVEPGGTGGCTISPQSLTTGCTAFGYNTVGERTIEQFPGGATQTAAYLPSGVASSVIGTNSTGVVQTSFVYTYTTTTVDKPLVYQSVENDPSTGGVAVTSTYTYDTDNRLTKAVVGSTTYNYAYDTAGNLCAKATSCASPTFTYNAANELTASPAGSTYTYDANGNETAGYATIAGTSTAITASYNNRNQTSSITPSGSGARSFTYADSNSSNRTASGSTTFDSSGNNVVRQTASGTSTYYIYDAQGNVQGEHIGSTSYYFLHNNISSIVAVVGSTGTVSDRYAYDPYGNVTASSGTVANPWQFAGGYYDASTGLTKFGNRYYDSTSGHWTQADTLSGNLTNPQSLNRFVYAGDNPVNFVDPSGNNLLGALFGLGTTLVGIGVGILGAPIIGGILTAVGVGLGIDAVACDLGGGYACATI